MATRGPIAGLALVVTLIAGCTAPAPVPHGHGSAASGGRPPLYGDLGTHHQPITTTSREARAYFDQGLRLTYAFNHHEARRAFQEAARLDPGCAMCYWGIALTQGSNYNSPTDTEREQAAYQAVQQARALAARATERERATIEALATRHSLDPKADRAALDRAYADAMREVVRRFPDDLDAATLFADSLMNVRPWDLWQRDGTPHPGTDELVRTLERVLARNPEHPGALHLYIHAVEASPEPRRAEAAADRLRALMPGAGHMVHMPSHIYWRVGRYADAAFVNEQAVAADRAFFRRSQPSPIYRMLYYPHNLDFIWHAASMEGRSVETLRAARDFAATAPPEMIAQMPDMETAPAAPLFALARFGRWEEILRQPPPPATMPYVRGAWHYTRGLAHAALGRRPEAERELTELRTLTAAVPPHRSLAFFFKSKDMLELASQILGAEIAARGGASDEAVPALLEAVARQDGHWFTEPPPWYFPVRQALGAVLLQAGRPAEAEAVYRDDLKWNPGNGWSLFGLARSQSAQEKSAEASETERRFHAAWARADVRLPASRF